jgi:hypothetical protein
MNVQGFNQKYSKIFSEGLSQAFILKKAKKLRFLLGHMFYVQKV